MLQPAWTAGGRRFETVKTQYAKDLNLNKALAETAEAIRTSGVSYDAPTLGGPPGDQVRWRRLQPAALSPGEEIS